MSEPILARIEGRNEAFKGFHEGARWTVSLDGEEIGHVWRGDRYDGVKCWMKMPAVLGFSIPSSSVGSGYSRTSKVGCVSELLQWHMNKIHSLRLEEGNLHCATIWPTGRRYYVLSRSDEIQKAVWCEHNDTEKPHLGAAGGIGWHLTSYRGKRMICGHEIEDLDGALGYIIRTAMVPPARDELNHFAYPTAERFYQSDIDHTLSGLIGP